jgi:hypothetical protein
MPTGRFTLNCPRNKALFKKALEEGGSDHQMVVFSDLRSASDKACTESLESALAITPWSGTRSVILLVDGRSVEWWMPYVALGSTTHALEVVSLRRFDRLGLRAWAVGHEAAFQDEESRQRLSELTGGWPALIERADEIMSSAGSGSISTIATLSELEAALKNEPELAEVLVATLEPTQGCVRDMFTMLAGEPSATMSPEDLAEMAEGECTDPLAAVEALRALGVLRVTEDGELGVEPVMGRAWLATSPGVTESPIV